MTQDVEAGKAGQSFEDFLKEQGTCEETTERAVRRVLAIADRRGYERAEYHEGGDGEEA